MDAEISLEDIQSDQFSFSIKRIEMRCNGHLYAIGSVRPAGKWGQGLTCQTAKAPACHIQLLRLVLEKQAVVSKKSRLL